MQRSCCIAHATGIEAHVNDLLLHLRQTATVAVVEQKTPCDTRSILAQVALSPAARFATFDDLLAVTMGTVDGDEGHGPLLVAGHSQDWAQCAIYRSPSPLLKHYPKTVRLIAYRYATRARLAQQIARTVFADTVAGRRVVISSDGGRIRLRETKRGPPTKKGRRCSTGAWREPKGLSVYVVDAAGKREASFAPFIDATRKGPDAVFALLRSDLQQLGITQADPILFIADGAPWRWKRVPLLVQAVGLAAEQVHALLDFSHAVQHLGQVAALRKDWSAKARSRWRTQQRRLLLQGEVEQGMTAVQGICRGRNSKAIRTHRAYFVKNQSRMAYAQLLAMKLPIGSGAIESTGRRVVKLRLKGSSIFWCRAGAEAILLLRSYYKAGRWNLWKRMATSYLALLET